MIISLSLPAFSEVRPSGSCQMDVVELQRKRAALRRAVACDMMPTQCPAILGLGAMAAAGAGYAANRMATKSAGIGKQIRNPFAKMCSVTEYRFKKFSELVANRFVLPPAQANSCELDLKFLNRDLDTAVQTHTSEVGKLVKAQQAEIEKLNAAKRQAQIALAKALGVKPDTDPRQLANLAQSTIAKPPPPPMDWTRVLNSEENRLRRLLKEAKQFKDDHKRLLYTNGLPENDPRVVSAKKLAVLAHNEVLEEFGNDQGKVKAFEERIARLAETRASSNTIDRAALTKLSQELSEIASKEAAMNANMSKLNFSVHEWMQTQAGRLRNGIPKGLPEARLVLDKITQEGGTSASLRMTESRLAQVEFKAGMRAGVRNAALLVGRTAGKGIARLGVVALSGPVGAGVAFASEALSPTQMGCGNMTAYYLSKTDNCATDYEVNGKNADVLFSDEIGKQLYFSKNSADKQDYMCFIKANWEKRFARWNVTCKPGPKDTGMFQGKIYAKRADGTNIYFQQSTNPTVIKNSLTSSLYYAQALEIASCCNDTNPRISDYECKSNYGITVASASGSGGSNNSGSSQKSGTSR